MRILKENFVVFEKVRFAENYGLMFKKKPYNNEAIIIKLKKESRFNAMIHMLFVFYPIYVIWLRKDKVIVDIKKCYPFQLFSIPKKSASYVIECCRLPNLLIGDRLDF